MILLIASIISFCTADQVIPVVTLSGGSINEGYPTLHFNNGSVHVGVCGGNKGFANSACNWAGYHRGGDIVPEKWSDTTNSNVSWRFRFECEEGADNLTGCVTKQCGDHPVGRVYLRCHPADCTLPNGRIPKQCKFYQEQGLCKTNKTVQDMCRRTCEICQENEAQDHELGTGTDQELGTSTTNEELWTSTDQELGTSTTDGELWTSTNQELGTTDPITTTITSSPSCRDYRDYKDSCRKWRDSGHCSNNKSVRGWCQATCGLCNSTCHNTLPIETCRVAVESGSCHDNIVVLRGCRLECGVCGYPQCRDVYRNSSCRVWRDKGRCGEVRYICAETCGKCSNTVTMVTEYTGCVDTMSLSLCGYFKRAGYCEVYKKALSTQCKRTCGYCEVVENQVEDLENQGGKSGVDHQDVKSGVENQGEEDEESQVDNQNQGLERSGCKDEVEREVCGRWAAGGYCETNSRVRQEYCRDTCNSC
eukprot:sb/3464316/